MNSSKVSLIFCTCDAYADLWDNYFYLFKKYWPEFEGQIILNTETKSCQYDGLSISEPLYCGADMSWSDRLSISLKKAKNPYVLIMLEDFYLKAPVDHVAFLDTLVYMQKHSDICSITYLREPGVTCAQKDLSGFFLRKQFSLYKMTAHITLYRKDYLLALLKKHESAWEFEVNGTIRSWFKRGKFFAPGDNNTPIFPYDFGSLVLRGKYYGPVKRYFEEKEKIVFSDQRETIEEWPAGSGEAFGKKIRYLVMGLLSIFKENA